MNSDPIQFAFTAVATRLGFAGRERTWRLVTPETVLVVDLQRSELTRSYSIALGVWLNALGARPRVAERDCHIRQRAEALATEIVGRNVRVSEVLAVGDPRWSDDERERLCRVWAEESVFPALIRRSTLTELRAMQSAGELSKAFVHADARRLLSTDG